MKRKTLYSELQTSLRILENRKMMIPSYCDQSLHWNGHNHYTMDMIPDLEKQIEELKAAISGIEEWRKDKWKMKMMKKKLALETINKLGL